MYNSAHMSLKMNGFGSTALLVALTAGLSAQTPAPTSSAAGAAQEKPTFKVQVDLVTSDIIVRDEKGNFIPDLKKDEFEVYEDGVKQDITSMTVVTGGRVTNVLAPPPPPPPEGIILPPSASEDRRVGTHLPLLRRRSAPAVPQHRPRARSVQEDLEGARARRRHVRHRLERPVVDRRST